MISNFVESVSTYAADVDNLIMLIAVIVGVWFILAEGVFFFFIFKFRKKEGQPAQYISGEEKHQKKWINIPHMLVLICDIFIIVGAVNVWVDIKQTLPKADYTIRVIGQQWAWSFVHPGADGKLDTADDIRTVDDLHIEVDKTYHFELQSTDVLHSFSVPVFRLKQDALPGRTITGWFNAKKTGQYDIQCAEICGIGHGIMFGRIHIASAADHTAWVNTNTPSKLASAQ